MYDSVRHQRGPGDTDMFNVAGRFDRRRFWIYAALTLCGARLSASVQRQSRCQFRLMASLELLTIVEADARGQLRFGSRRSQ
jgi:hypothetical protein